MVSGSHCSQSRQNRHTQDRQGIGAEIYFYLYYIFTEKKLQVDNKNNFTWFQGQLKRMTTEVAAVHFYLSRFIPERKILIKSQECLNGALIR